MYKHLYIPSTPLKPTKPYQSCTFFFCCCGVGLEEFLHLQHVTFSLHHVFRLECKLQGVVSTVISFNHSTYIGISNSATYIFFPSFQHVLNRFPKLRQVSWWWPFWKKKGTYRFSPCHVLFQNDPIARKQEVMLFKICHIDNIAPLVPVGRDTIYTKW